MTLISRLYSHQGDGAQSEAIFKGYNNKVPLYSDFYYDLHNSVRFKAAQIRVHMCSFV